MKILGIIIVRPDPPPAVLLAQELELSSISFFARSQVAELITWSCMELGTRTPRGVRQTVEITPQYTQHIRVSLDGLMVAIITDSEYPPRVAHTIIGRVIDEFISMYPTSTWRAASRPLSMPSLRDILNSYQDPTQADPLMRVQKEVDETTQILRKTVDSLLERGERLDDLVEKSNDLGAQSKAFFKVAKKKNSCCGV